MKGVKYGVGLNGFLMWEVLAQMTPLEEMEGHIKSREVTGGNGGIQQI